MEQTKPYAKSLTIQGAVVVLASFLINQFGADMDDGQLIEIISALFVLGGWAMTIVGRLRAKHSLK